MAGCEAFVAADLKRMLEYCLEHALFLCAVLALGCGTGPRISEALLMRRRDILQQGRIPDLIKLPKLKTGKEDFREIPWNHALDKYLLPWLLHQQEVSGLELGTDYVFSRKPGQAVDRRQVWAELKGLFKRLDIPGKKATHSMRKTFARFIYDYYLDKYHDQLKALEMTRRALGHAFIDTTVRYLNLDLDDLQSATEKVFKFLE